jgi:hypothetical protein
LGIIRRFWSVLFVASEAIPSVLPPHRSCAWQCNAKEGEPKPALFLGCFSS